MIKPKILCLLLAVTAALVSLPGNTAIAAEPRPLVREIFVPESDLDALLEGQPERMLLSRQEYEELLKKAEKTPEKHAPRKAVVIAADYAATVEQGRARLVGTLELEVLEDGLWAVPLKISGVGVRRASLDERTAPLARTGGDELTLFVEGVGRHQFVLEMVAAMETTAARQRLTVRLPEAPASQLRLTVPGDVEIKSGADVAERVVDVEAGVTRFELPTASGPLDLQLSLNSRLLRSDRVVVARSVFVDEITEAYERLHATVSMAVLQRAVERFEFVVPDGFEITDVTTPQLARWAVADRERGRVLEVQLREPATETVLLTLSAMRTDTDLSNWALPRFVPLDVVAESAVVGLLVEQRLIAETVSSEGLIPIDTSVLRKAIPETVFHAAPGAPPIRPITAWYAPQGEFGVSASFLKPPAGVAVTTNLLLILEDQRQRVQGGFLLAPEAESLFEVEIDISALWHVTSVTEADEKPLSFERYGALSVPGRVKVRLPHGVDPGQEYRIYFEAEAIPPGWLGEWETQTVEFPKFAVRAVGREVGAIAVDARDDMLAQPAPEGVQRLAILGKEDKAKYLAGVVTDLAYRYESGEYRLPLVVERTTPRMTASTYSFLRVEPDAFVVHYELIYQVEEARARRLALVLPDDTPEAVSIRGLDGVQLKEYVSTVENGKRRWDVLLAEPRAGQIRLAVDFHQPLSVEDQKGLPLPIVLADGVVWQSGHIAVEGDAELEVAVQPNPQVRRVDVGELVDAEYQPGRRLLGVFGFVDTPGTITVDVIRREGHALFSAIVHGARLVSRVSAAGACQTMAEFRLLTKVPLLEVTLPEKAELWSGNVDGTPIKPQKEGNRWLINLPATSQGQIITLQMVYEMPVAATGFRGRIDMPAPQLRFRSEGSAVGQLVPIADLQWDLHPPSGCTVLDSSGTVMWQPDRPVPAVWTVAKNLGGALLGSPWLAMPLASRSASRIDTAQSYMADDVMHFAQEGMAVDSAAPAEDEFDQMLERKPEGLDRLEALGRTSRDLERPAAKPAEPPMPEAAAAQPPAKSRAIAGVVVEDEPLAPQRRGFKSAKALRIELQTGPAEKEDVVTFTSLGSAPRLVVTLADRPGISILSCGIGLLILFAGLLLTMASVRIKVRYVLAVILAGSLIPLLESILPFMPDLSITLQPCNVAVYAAGLLLPYYLIAGFVRWLAQTAHALLSSRRAAVAAVLLLAASLAWMPKVCLAEPPQARPYVVEVVDALPPVAIPGDAVVIPYNAAKRSGVENAERMLVPYAKYVELWNRAYPDEKKAAVAPPADYALAGVSYRVTLVDDGDLLLDGRMEIDVFVDKRTAIPLGLAGGVFARAELDGEAARLSVPEIAAAANEPLPQQAAQPVEQQATQMEARPIVLLHAQGKGRHEFDFTVRMRLDRRGGWRTVESRVPTAAAAAIEIRVPQAQTEVLLQQVQDRLAHETTEAGEVIRTALDSDGVLSLQWRPSVAEGVVDHSLTAESTAVLDVQEDGVRLAWSLQLEFRRSQHEQFSVHVPSDYLVERVDGTNVRGWEVKEEVAGSKVTITLLKAAEGREELVLYLWRAQAMGGETETRFASPAVRVDGAALHKGRITIRRSPMLDLRVESVSDASRTDVPEDAGGQALSAEESPLGIRPFQAYRFSNTDYAIRLVATTVRARISAAIESILRISEYERVLECRIRYSVGNRPMHQAEILLPAGFDLEDVTAPGEFEWSVTNDEGRPKLTVLLATGQEGSVAIVFEGRLALEQAGQDVAIPNVEILGVADQQGQMAVQVDPVFDVAARDLVGCRSLLLNQIANWLSAEQQKLTAVAMGLTSADYSGLLRLTQRQPDVHCDTITNIRVTDRALEETILLDYRIEHAGVREVSFVLPSWMADARIRVPMLRQKTVEPTDAGDGAPLRVVLELQDEVMGQLQVLVENDRMLQTGVDFRAAIPDVIKGESFDAFSVRQFVTLEKAGLDEIQTDDAASAGVERLSRRQLQWAHLKRVLGDGITEAFLVADAVDDRELVFRARRFEARHTTDARIGMAETRFVLDQSGAYRAEQLYWIDNRTEQYLEIDMPEGATLWTAQIWTYAAWTAHQKGEPAVGEPIKPTRAPDSAGPRRVRIPLVKTAEGDSDYVVRLQYAGAIGPMGTYATFDLPFIKPIGIKVDQSQVRLYVPESYWYDFDDTMTLVRDEGDLAAGRSAYETKKLEKFKDVLREGNLYAKARALNSVEVLNSNQMRFGDFASNEKFQVESYRNAAMMKEVQEAKVKVEASLQQTAELDNRDRLRQQVQQQSNYFARNMVQNLGSNFEADRAAARGAPSAAKPDSGSFNSLWLDRSQLSNEPSVAAGEKAEESRTRGKQSEAAARLADGRQLAAGWEKAGKSPAGPGVSQRKSQAAADSKDMDEGYGYAGIAGTESLNDSEQQRQAVARYQARHMQQQQAVGQSFGAVQGGVALGEQAAGMGGGGQYAGAPDGGPVFSGQRTTTATDQPALEVASSVNAPSSLQGQIAALLPAGLASLEVEFPFRGREYKFTTPQGGVRISGRAVAAETVNGLGQATLILLLVAMAAYVVYLGAGGRFDWWLGRTGSTCLLLVGLLAFLCLPVVGVLAIVGGVMLKVNRIMAARGETQSPLAGE